MRRIHGGLFGPSGADQRKAQDGCQNGQPWLDAFQGVPLRYRIQAMEMSADRKKIHDRPGRQDQNKKISNFFVFLEGICISVLNTIHIREETTRNESHTFLRQDLPTKGRDVLWQPSLEVKI